MSLPHALAAVSALGPEWIQPTYILEKFGTAAFIAVLVIIFIECGLFVFFLPGDSLLFVTGLFISTGQIAVPLWLACILLSLAAWLGNLAGYAIGRRVGPSLFHRPNSRLLNPEGIAKTHAFFEKYGGRAIILGQFIPFVRTYIPVAAGVGKMPYRHFATFNIVGALIWGVGVTLLGFSLGSVAFVKDHYEIAVGLVLFVSLIPIMVEWIRHRLERRREAKASA